MASIAVLGAGSWGTALAIVLSRNCHGVRLWGHDPGHMDVLAREHRNARYLPDIPLPDNIRIESKLDLATRDCDQVLIAVPSQAFRPLLIQLEPCISDGVGIAWATKGLELETGLPLHRVVADVLGPDLPAAILSGPTFAGEVAAGQPTALTVASKTIEFAMTWVGLLHNACFRAYSSTDITGVELGGAIKNVLAIAAGVADGLGYGANARAALITRGLAEMMRLGTRLGGRADTLMGLSGVGDLILTCTDNQSRNRRFGVGLGKGRDPATVRTAIGQEIEGIPTARIVHQLARTNGIDMPITEQVYRILYEALPPAEAVNNLLLREPKAETSGH